MSGQTVYDAAGGEAGMLRLAEAWHARALADEIMGHPFEHGYRDDHVVRLAAYWGESLGGPATYSGGYGDQASVVRMHSCDEPHEEMDRRAIACFDRALDDVGIAGQPLRGVLHDWFAWATTVDMARYHGAVDAVPAGLPMPRWTWDGLQEP